MRRTRPFAALASLGIAAALIATAPAAAAPEPTENQNPRAVQVQKNQAFNAIRVQNRAYGIIRAKVVVCTRPAYPAPDTLKTRARAELQRAAQRRLTALVGLRRALPLPQVNRRQQIMLNNTRSIQSVNRLCIAVRGAAAGATNVPGTTTPAPAPIQVQVPAGPGAPPVTVSQTPVTVGDLLGLGRVLPDGLLPQTLSIADSLVPNLLTATNGVLAVNPNDLIAALDGVIRNTLPQCQLLDVACLLNGTLATVNGLLNSVLTTLTTGNINDLLTVGSLSGNVLQLVPTGDLAALLNALPADAITGLLGTEIGTLNILG